MNKELKELGYIIKIIYALDGLLINIFDNIVRCVTI